MVDRFLLWLGAGVVTAGMAAAMLGWTGVAAADTLSGSDAGGATSSLEKVPDGIPIYQLAAPRYFWNQFGVGTDALLEARPDRFIGVTLVGGSHVDSMRCGNPLIQFSQELVAGYSRPENAAAAQMLMVGWAFTLDTPGGEATLVALPNSLTKPFLLNLLQALVPLGKGFFTCEPTCVSDSMAVAGCKGSMAA
jgi:hypothetical protein